MSDSVQDKKLIEAIEAKDLDAVKAALGNGASPDARETASKWKHTALIIALENEQHDIAVCLLDAGANIHAIDGLQVNPVHYAATSGFTDIVERLLNEGIEVDIRNVWEKTPLMHAAEKNRVDTMRFLVDRGADINAQDRDDCSILASAAAYEATQAALFLLEQGVDPNAEQTHPPLHLAADKGDVTLSKALIEAGASVQTKNFSGSTPLHVALRKGEYFKPEDYAGQMKPYIEIAKLLLEHPDMDIEARDNSKHTPLLAAASHGNLEMIKALETKGADPHVRGDYDESMLMLAASFRRYDTVKYLVETGHDVNQAPDKWGNTVFLKASGWARVNILELLKENGADMTVSNKKNENALMIAVKRGKEDGIRYLLDQNVFDLTQRDHEGKSAQDIARSFTNPEFAEMIDAHIEKLKREALEKQRREEEARRQQVASELAQEGDLTKSRVSRIRKKHGARRLPRP